MNKTFVLAGDAIFTVECPDGKHFTYRVQHCEASEEWPESYFVKLLTGPDNNSSYSYLGKLNKETGAMFVTRKSRISPSAFSVRLLNRVLACIWADDLKYLAHGYNVHHEGRCGRCAARLTVPESILSGFGPECIKHV